MKNVETKSTSRNFQLLEALDERGVTYSKNEDYIEWVVGELAFDVTILRFNNDITELKCYAFRRSRFDWTVTEEYREDIDISNYSLEEIIDKCRDIYSTGFRG